MIEVDMKEYARQSMKAAEENGLVAKIFIEDVDFEEAFDSERDDMICAPGVLIEGKRSPMNIALMILTCREFIKDLEKEPDVKEVLRILEEASEAGRRIDVEGEF